MTRSNLKNKLIIGCLALFVLGFLPSGWALLQGNRAVFIKDLHQASAAEPLSIVFKLDESTPDTDYWIPLGKRDVAAKTIEPADLREMGYLSFRVKMEREWPAQPVNLSAEIREDTDKDKRYVFGKDAASRALAWHFSGTPDEKEWRRVVIPFSQFRGLRRRDRLLELGLILEIKKGSAKGKLFVDQLLFGTHYPEGMNGKEIRMQNRVSSFKIGKWFIGPKTMLRKKPVLLTLTMTFIDPYLEAVRFEDSEDGGRSWRPLESFYDHAQGGVYKMLWNPRKSSPLPKGFWIRAVGIDVLGGEVTLAGPYLVHLN